MASTQHYVTNCANAVLQTTSSARMATAAGMQRVGAAARRRPGPRGTIWAQLCSGRGLPGEIRCHRQTIMAGRWPFAAIAEIFSIALIIINSHPNHHGADELRRFPRSPLFFWLWHWADVCAEYF